MLNGRGKGLVLGILFLLTVGTLLATPELFAMAGGLASLAVYSYLVTRSCARKLKLTHHGPTLVQVGQPFELYVGLYGSHATAQMRLDVSMNLPETLELLDVKKQERMSDALAAWRCTMMATARGEHEVGQITINLQDPVGLICLRQGIAQSVSINAWPQPMDPGIDLRALDQPSITDRIESSTMAIDGSSTYGVRQWAPGDALRRVHWPSTARLGRLAVMEFENEISRDLMICLDTRSAQNEEAFETGCRIVSYFLHQAWQNGRATTLLADGKSAIDLSLDNKSSHREILNMLATVSADSKKSLEESILAGLAKAPSQGGLIFITTYWDADTRRTFGALQGSNSKAMAIVVSGDQAEDYAVVETISGIPGVYILGTDDSTRQ